MVDLIEKAFRLQSFLETHACRFCFIGGIAVQSWGEPRLTRDIDISLLAGFGGEETYIDLLLGAYRPRIPDVRHFALQHRVLLLVTPGGTGIDVSLTSWWWNDHSSWSCCLAGNSGSVRRKTSW